MADDFSASWIAGIKPGTFRSMVDTVAEGGPQHGRLEETVLEPSEASEKVLVLDITGIISSFTVIVGELEWSIGSMIADPEEDYAIKAVILKVDSPEVRPRLRQNIRAHSSVSGGLREAGHCQYGSLLPVVAITFRRPSMDCCASTDHHGSIGVIMHGYTDRDLMDKAGVAPNAPEGVSRTCSVERRSLRKFLKRMSTG